MPHLRNGQKKAASVGGDNSRAMQRLGLGRLDQSQEVYPALSLPANTCLGVGGFARRDTKSPEAFRNQTSVAPLSAGSPSAEPLWMRRSWKQATLLTVPLSTRNCPAPVAAGMGEGHFAADLTSGTRCLYTTGSISPRTRAGGSAGSRVPGWLFRNCTAAHVASAGQARV